MTPVLQLFKMEPASDSHYKQHAVKEFLVTVKETVGNMHKQLSNVHGNVASDMSTVGFWEKQVRDGEVGKV
jgi:hypothetical protein